MDSTNSETWPQLFINLICLKDHRARYDAHKHTTQQQIKITTLHLKKRVAPALIYKNRKLYGL